MIVVYHHKNKVVDIGNVDLNTIDKGNTLSIVEFLFALAKDHSDEILIWCDIRLKEALNSSEIATLFHHKRLLMSYNPSKYYFIDKRIGYVEESPFIKVNKTATYPTWQMSSLVGGIYGSSLLALKKEVIHDKDFDYFLCSLAKLGMPKGLLCYSEPKLLKQKEFIITKKSNDYILFRFVKQHYKIRWVFLLLGNLMLYERKFPIVPFLFSLFYRNRTNNNINLDHIKVQSSKKVVEQGAIDVIIPTIGRKDYLYDVLCDLRKQTHLPVNVIIVEQNPLVDSVSELDYLTNESWPFGIKHTFTHQAGACNARNVALSQTESEWVFLADDDIRIESEFTQESLSNINNFGIEAAIFNCLSAGQINNYTIISQTTIFGSGCSIVKKAGLENLKFNESLEFGYGEDTDFGLQLRNNGVDVIYFPNPSIVHLKAPMGGFRIKPTFRWSAEKVQPKPSPTIMYVKQKHDTKEQIKGYKTVLFLKLLKLEGRKNPIQFLYLFQKKWNASLYWFNQLDKVKQ